MYLSQWFALDAIWNLTFSSTVKTLYESLFIKKKNNDMAWIHRGWQCLTFAWSGQLVGYIMHDLDNKNFAEQS